jgi:RNA polymerase sigma factor (sigma-70 family)
MRLRVTVEAVCAPAGTQPIEADLIDHTLRGRGDAFADLIRPHVGPLNQFARRRLQSASEAEDVVQQSMFLAFCKLRQFRREASFKTWLSAIALNEVFRSLRRQSAAHTQPLADAFAGGLADPSTSPHVQCEQSERIERLHRALTRLPEKYRLIIQLRDLHELSIAETARSLAVSRAAVRTRHHRARKLLKHSYAAVQQEGSKHGDSNDAGSSPSV